MSSISIIGLGNMAGATVGTAGTAPTGDVVVLAVPYASAATVVSEYGDALRGKVIIDIALGVSVLS
ncbi:NAD(P)-binding domain-containing protein [Amycolatopsis sp. lyj-112]|uniref:NAD(P)-binding domain-containing protein n=1 Tax=Amycolatopsis sp. lyj-112 TaxID=2789288 RepID=UPI00397DAD49